MVQESHYILGDKVQVYRRDNSRYWQCATFLNDRRHRKSTGEDSLALAKQIAEDWYFELRGKARAGILTHDKKTFRQVADTFLQEYAVITEGHRSQKWTEGHAIRLRVHLNPFFGDLGISEVTAGKVQEYRVHRMTSAGLKPAESKDNRPARVKAPSRNTIHNELITLRQVLKTAVRHDWLKALPDLSTPYKTRGRSFTAHGSARLSTRRSTVLPGSTRRPRRSGSVGKRNRCTTMFCSSRTPGSGRTRPKTCSIET